MFCKKAKVKSASDEDSDGDDRVKRVRTVVLLGNENVLDENLEWRLKVGYRGTIFFGIIGLISFISYRYVPGNTFLIISTVSACIAIAFLSMIMHCKFGK